MGIITFPLPRFTDLKVDSILLALNCTKQVPGSNSRRKMFASVAKRSLMQHRNLLRTGEKCLATAVRHYSQDSLPWNKGIMFVPQQEAWVVERMGKFNSILEPGINFLNPILDKVKYVQILKEKAIVVPHQA